MKVKKEATVAVVIGLIIALLVFGGILRARQAIQSIKVPSNEDTTVKTNSESPTTQDGLFVELTTPDNTVTQEDTLTLSGKTLPGTYIAILGEKGEYLIVPNDLGSFSQEISLIKGANTIRINIYLEDGTKIEKTINAVYTTAQI